ncbi:MAG TPA: hypothetical protein VLH08_03965 [Acidobacteriota bacterium]|nr:hypothetical protein [Acidobacteriota bacterium]
MKVNSNQTVQSLQYSQTETTKETAKAQTAEVQTTANEKSDLALKQNAFEAKADRNLTQGIIKADLERQAQGGLIKDPSAGAAPKAGPEQGLKLTDDPLGPKGNVAQSPLEQYKQQAEANMRTLQNGIAQGLTNAGMSPNFAKHLTGTGQQAGPRVLGEPGTQHRPAAPDLPVDGTAGGLTTSQGPNNQQQPDLTNANAPGLQARENPLTQYKNGVSPRTALAGNDAGVNDGGTKTGTTAAEPKQTQPKEESWIERIARQLFGPMSNEHARKQDPEYQQQHGTKERPAEDAPQKGEASSDGYMKIPGQVADPPSEDHNTEHDVERLAARIAASAGTKVNPNPNDDGSTSGEAKGPVMPGVVDPPDDPLGGNEPSPRVVGGPIRPSGPGGGIIGPRGGDGQPH